MVRSSWHRIERRRHVQDRFSFEQKRSATESHAEDDDVDILRLLTVELIVNNMFNYHLAHCIDDSTGVLHLEAFYKGEQFQSFNLYDGKMPEGTMAAVAADAVAHVEENKNVSKIYITHILMLIIVCIKTTIP